MKPLALFFPYRCTYRIEFHLKNALHQSTVKAITNTQLLWHHFITGDTLKCNARAVLNILKVKLVYNSRGSETLSGSQELPNTSPNPHLGIQG